MHILLKINVCRPLLLTVYLLSVYFTDPAIEPRKVGGKSFLPYRGASRFKTVGDSGQQCWCYFLQIAANTL